ncbi:hypothetical protein [Photobacterium sp. OFAV2-7]|uniref:hypothetical protein n=1 Tax=Photobacterium sp. OFAV2-7 TaxID=2917748 RepID=UPI001EF42E89|nr:hypothetical protein [Photobacterium sp. OFAV2-7]MCG7584587.1 hypothetical protein [Photobacterium sp. OFAV2-7]
MTTTYHIERYAKNIPPRLKASDGTRYDWTHAYAMKDSYFEARTAEEAIAYFNQRSAQVRPGPCGWWPWTGSAMPLTAVSSRSATANWRSMMSPEHRTFLDKLVAAINDKPDGPAPLKVMTVDDFRQEDNLPMHRDLFCLMYQFNISRGVINDYLTAHRAVVGYKKHGIWYANVANPYGEK